MTTYQTENKEQKLMIIIVLGQKYYLAFNKGQFLVTSFKYFLGGSLFCGKRQILQVMQMIARPLQFILFNWFKNNRLKNNVDKCHVLVSTKKPVGIKIGDYAIENSECEKLLGVKIDANFNEHISDLCKKASRQIYALARVTPFMGLRK